jgi:hypothetical protein
MFKHYAVYVLLSILLSHNAIIHATVLCAPDGTPYDPSKPGQKNAEYAASYCTQPTVGFSASINNSTEPERRNDDIATYNASPTSSTSSISSGKTTLSQPTFKLHYRLAGDDIFGYGAGAYAPENQPDNHGDIARKYWGP